VIDTQRTIDTGATTLVAAMEQPAWTNVRDRVAHMLGSGDPRNEQTEIELLDESRQFLLNAEPARQAEIAGQVLGEVRSLLRIRLGADPTRVAAFAALVDSIATELGLDGQPARGTSQTAIARDNARIYQAGRDIGNIGR
jgi:hypothetical protein